MSTTTVRGTEAIYSEDPMVFYNIVEKPGQSDDLEKELIILLDEQIQRLCNTGKLSLKKIPKKAKYKHYKKSSLYSVRGIVRNPDTLEIFVWYQAEYFSENFGDKSHWVRPIDMFLEPIPGHITRFEFVGY